MGFNLVLVARWIQGLRINACCIDMWFSPTLEVDEELFRDSSLNISNSPCFTSNSICVSPSAYHLDPSLKRLDAEKSRFEDAKENLVLGEQGVSFQRC